MVCATLVGTHPPIAGLTNPPTLCAGTSSANRRHYEALSSGALKMAPEATIRRFQELIAAIAISS